MDKPNLTHVNIDDLKVGDKVGVCKYPSYGWNQKFRYPIVTKQIITKITPKRTKFVLDNGAELNIREAKSLVILDQNTDYMTKIATQYNRLKNMLYQIDQDARNSKYVVECGLTDDELIEYCNAVEKIYNKIQK